MKKTLLIAVFSGLIFIGCDSATVNNLEDTTATVEKRAFSESTAAPFNTIDTAPALMWLAKSSDAYGCALTVRDPETGSLRLGVKDLNFPPGLADGSTGGRIVSYELKGKDRTTVRAAHCVIPNTSMATDWLMRKLKFKRNQLGKEEFSSRAEELLCYPDPTDPNWMVCEYTESIEVVCPDCTYSIIHAGGEEMWIEIYSGWEGEGSGGGSSGGGSNGTTTTWSLPHTDSMLSGDAMPPDCTKSTLTNHESAWCGGEVMSSWEETSFNNAISNLHAKGGVCSELASLADELKSGLRTFPMNSYGFSAAARQGHDWWLIAKEIFTYLSYAETANTQVSLQSTIAHEMDHVRTGLGAELHLSSTGHHTYYSLQCSP